MAATWGSRQQADEAAAQTACFNCCPTHVVRAQLDVGAVEVHIPLNALRIAEPRGRAAAGGQGTAWGWCWGVGAGQGAQQPAAGCPRRDSRAGMRPTHLHSEMHDW